jgi:hypothetical protein
MEPIEELNYLKALTDVRLPLSEENNDFGKGCLIHSGKYGILIASFSNEIFLVDFSTFEKLKSGAINPHNFRGKKAFNSKIVALKLSLDENYVAILFNDKIEVFLVSDLASSSSEVSSAVLTIFLREVSTSLLFCWSSKLSHPVLNIVFENCMKSYNFGTKQFLVENDIESIGITWDNFSEKLVFYNANTIYFRNDAGEVAFEVQFPEINADGKIIPCISRLVTLMKPFSIM